MDIDILRGELERLFKLDELVHLTQELLGWSPEEVGGATSSAAFARALVERCREREALDALVDAVAASRTELDPKLRDLLVHGFPVLDDLTQGSLLGDVTVGRKIGEGPVAQTYLAKRDGKEIVLRVLRSEVAFDRRRVARYQTAVRLVGRVSHAGLASGTTAGPLGDRVAVTYEHVEAQPLSARLARTGPMHLNEARPLLKAILEVLAALHDKRLVHGNLKLENVLLARGEGGAQRVIVVDAGTDRLRRRARAAGDVLGMVVTPKIAAPELHRGKGADVRSDVYAFGVLLFELLSGKPPFSGGTPVELAVAHMSKAPEPPSAVAPRGWVTKELDTFVLSLLEKEPSARPRDGRALLEALETLGRATTARAASKIDEEELTRRVDALVADPGDHDAALKLEGAVEEGAEPARVAEAFSVAADTLEVSGEDAQKHKETKKALLFRAARIFEAAKALEDAETAYASIVDLGGDDDIAIVALEEVRRQLGKYEELVEMLLVRSERATSRSERARALADIGKLYAHELDDKAQALVAFTQALCEDAQDTELAEEVERLAGTDQALWAEVANTVGQAVQGDLPPEARTALLLLLGGWYGGKLSRPDLALPCYQTIVQGEPSNDAALAGMAAIYRAAQQWPELGAVLLRRADVTTSPVRARDFKASAAELLDGKLNEPHRAKDIYEQILADDPAHEQASLALAKIYERTGDYAALVKILDKQADALRGEDRARAYCKIAELHEGQLDDLAEAVRRYEAALAADERHLDALKGLDRIFNRTGKYKELLANLDRQLQVAATPRQKINLLERIAGIHDEEFLDHEAAAKAYEGILKIDSAHENSLTALARHYRALDRWEDVSTLYERHLKVATDDARRQELLLARGRVLSEQVGSPERAMSCYQQVLEITPDHSGALEALARLREQSGDALAALDAIEALAAKAATAEQKAEQWMRAAKLLEARGDRDGAIQRYKAALDADPTNAAATVALRSAYAARGDSASAADLISREIEAAQGNLSKARLYGELAKLAREKLGDKARAQDAAKKAIELDPTALDSLLILGDFAFEDGKFLEAARSYESLASRTDALSPADARRVLGQYVDALLKTGGEEKAVAAVDRLLELAPDDLACVGRAFRVHAAHGDAKKAFELGARYTGELGGQLRGHDKAEALYRYGEAARKVGELDKAVDALTEATEVDPAYPAPVDALAEVFGDKGDWEEVLRIKNRRLDVLSGDERSAMLVEIGDVIATKIGDRTRAAKSFVAALEDRPDDRKLLTKLMQLYSEEKDWAKLVEIVVRLADFVDDKKQKAKYLLTAAGIVQKELQDLDQAVALLDRVLELEPSQKALTDAIEVRRARAEWPEVEKLLTRQLEMVQESNDRDKLIATFDALGDLYQRHLGQTGDAIDAYEAAQTLDPDDRERNEKLADIYVSDPAKYLDKAVASLRTTLARNPHKPEGYKLLRKLYTESKRADAAWCLCQALTCLNLAEPDEERFFKRMRAESPAAAQDRLSEEDWVMRVRHFDADPLLTAVLSILEPTILAARAQPIETLGYDARYALDLSLHPYPMSQTLYYAAGVLGMTPPLTFQNPNDPGGLSFLHARTPGIVLGHAALSADVPPQAAAFLAARHLAYFRPGFYVRHLVPSVTGLKTWLFAAIKLIAPQFPLSADLEGPVKENLDFISGALKGNARDNLASVVTKMLSGGGSLDLKKWVQAVDLSADRAGFLVAHDLEVATELVKAGGDEQSSLPVRERAKELVLFAVSEEYFDLRRRLGIAIDS
ncbi:MAG: tetratricopeptide repeat protein [Polyangiaceae bacterium]|nr:tetratricopeptide repeat protein [Polyangiaceae bacterium]